MIVKILSKLLTISVLCGLLSGCTQSEKKTYDEVHKGVYFWQNELSLKEVKQMTAFPLDNLYIKFFEVHPHNVHKAIPKAQLKIDNSFKLGAYLKNLPESKRFEIVPVIHLKNQTFKDFNEQDSRWLADKVYNQVVAKWNDLVNLDNPKEIQFDCDWTSTTKESYFNFLKAIDSISDVTITSTINLYQLKYPDKAGFPPVDRAMLMYYNMGELEEIDAKNTILDNEIGRQYITSGMSYPLPLDFALPVFSWGVHYHLGYFKGLLPNFSKTKLEEFSCFSKKQNSSHYLCQKDTVIDDTYFRYGDVVRVEMATEKNLMEACNILKQIYSLNDKTNLAFFDWKQSTSNKHEKLHSVFRCFTAN